MASANTPSGQNAQNKSILERTVDFIKAVFIWIAFFILVGVILFWAWCLVIFDYRIVLVVTAIGIFFILKAVKRVFDYLNGRDDQKIEEKYGVPPTETPKTGGKNGIFTPSPLGVGEDGLAIDLKDGINSFLELYGEINFRDDNSLKRVMEAVPFRKVERGELDYTLAKMHKNKEIYVEDGKIRKENADFCEKSVNSEDRKPLSHGVHRQIWEIMLRLIQIHGFEKFHKEADQIFEKYPVSQYSSVLEALKGSEKHGQIMFFHFASKEEAMKAIKKTSPPPSKPEKEKPKAPPPIVKEAVPVTNSEDAKSRQAMPIIEGNKAEREIDLDEIESKALRSRFEMEARLKKLEEEMIERVKKEQEN
jgi:hypothetical protein